MSDPDNRPYSRAHATEVFLCVQVEESLNLKKLNGWLDQMTETSVSVSMPRFKVEDNFNLKEMLQELGLTDLFSAENASLPGAFTRTTFRDMTSRLTSGNYYIF